MRFHTTTRFFGMAATLAATQFACSGPNGSDTTAPGAEGLATASAADTLAAAAPATCDLSGTWASKISIPVTWPSTIAVQPGAGEIVQYTKITRVQTGTTFNDSLEICKIITPDYKSQALFGGELYGVHFPDALFDAGNLPISKGTGTLSTTAPGATYSLPNITLLLGLKLDNALTAAWPAKPGQIAATTDASGHPGIGVVAASEPGYSFPPVDLFRSMRAGKFQIALRNVGSSSGKIDSCDRMTGGANISVIANKPALDTHILGCTTTDGAACSVSQFELIDSLQPQYVPTGAGTAVTVRVPATATCANVRAVAY